MHPANKIVFPDAGSVDWGDISLAPLKALGAVKIYRHTRPEELYARLRGAETVITNKCRMDSRLLGRLKSLRSIHLTATGFNNIDIRAARRCGIAVTNVRDYCSGAVAQFTLAALLALAGSLIDYRDAVRRGWWNGSDFFTLPGFRIQEVRGRVLGIIGYGAIGRRVGRLARALGMKVLAARIPGRRYDNLSPRRHAFDTVLRQSDFLTIHAPLSPLTQSLIGAAEIRKMKPGAFIINMARGGIVDEAALKAALQSGRLGGAALDVLTQEPPPRRHPLIGAPRLILTPHVAWATREVRQELIHEIVKNIRSLRAGGRRNRVV